MEIFLGWLVLSVLVAVYASGKGKSGILYFLLAILLSPLLGFLIALISGDDTKKKCSNCGQNIDKSAKICPFCKVDMNPPSSIIIKNGKITKVDNSLTKLVLDKKTTTYTMNDLKRIVTENYEKKYRAEITADNNSLFAIRGRAEEFELNYIQIKSLENEFVIQAHNINIPLELEAKELIPYESNNSNISNVDKLIELGNLYKDGLLTKEEFEEQKKLLLLI